MEEIKELSVLILLAKNYIKRAEELEESYQNEHDDLFSCVLIEGAINDYTSAIKKLDEVFKKLNYNSEQFDKYFPEISQKFNLCNSFDVYFTSKIITLKNYHYEHSKKIVKKMLKNLDN